MKIKGNWPGLLVVLFGTVLQAAADTYIIDNPNATLNAGWAVGTSATGKYGSDYNFASTVAAAATYTATYTPNIAVAGKYDVYIWYPQGSNRALNAPWTVSYDGGFVTVPVNQTINGGNWFLIASCKDFAAGTTGYVQLANNTGASGAVVIADAVRIISSTAPSITTQPPSRTVCSGSSTTFSVLATGSAPISYQWKFNGSSVSGATASSYTISGSGPANAGSYTVDVSNPVGTTTSSAATLVVNTAPVIAVQPQSQTVCPGANVTFSVTASGATSFTYQWKLGGVNIAGATTSSYTVNSASVSGNYSVLVSDSCGSTTSSTAALTVRTALTIASQPANQTVCDNSTAEFDVTVAGSGPVNYQWYVNGATISGATSSSYITDSSSWVNGGHYKVIASGPCGSVTSSEAALNVVDPISIQTQPQSQAVVAGNMVTFSVGASGGGLGYQWRVNGANISGATSSSFSIANALVSSAGAYSVALINACGTIVSSDATLVVKSFILKGNQYVVRDGGAQTVVGFAESHIAGSVTYTVTADNPSLFSSVPSISSTGTLTYTPASAATGLATVTVQMLDSTGTVSGPSQSFTIKIGAPGAVMWEYLTGITVDYGVMNTAAVATDGTIYFGARDKGVIALNPDGTMKWTFPAASGYSFRRFSPAIGDDGTIYAGSTDGGLYAINPDGTMKWRTYISTWEASPSIGNDGIIYCGSNGTGLNAIRASDGVVLWSYDPAGQYVYSGPALGADGRIYFGATDNKLYALDHDGNFLWSYETGGLVITSPCIGADGSVYFGSEDGKEYGLNADGTLKWSFTTSGDVGSSVIDSDGVVYFGSTDGHLYAVNGSTGVQVWSYNALGAINGAPALCSDGTVDVLAGGNIAMELRVATGIWDVCVARNSGQWSSLYRNGQRPLLCRPRTRLPG